METVFSIDGMEPYGFRHHCLFTALSIMAEQNTLQPGAIVLQAQNFQFNAVEFINARNLLEHLDDCAYARIGDGYTDQFCTVHQDAQDELQKMLSEWCQRHIPERQITQNIRGHIVEESDIKTLNAMSPNLRKAA